MSVPLHPDFKLKKIRRYETDSNDFDGDAADLLLFGE